MSGVMYTACNMIQADAMTNKEMEFTMNEYLERAKIGVSSYTPACPDGWAAGGWALYKPSSLDIEMWGNDVLRIDTGHSSIPTLPVIIHITGKAGKCTPHGNYKIRVKFEFCKDEEPSEFSGGWLYYW